MPIRQRRVDPFAMAEEEGAQRVAQDIQQKVQEDAIQSATDIQKAQEEKGWRDIGTQFLTSAGIDLLTNLVVGSSPVGILKFLYGGKETLEGLKDFKKYGAAFGRLLGAGGKAATKGFLSPMLSKGIGEATGYGQAPVPSITMPKGVTGPGMRDMRTSIQDFITTQNIEQQKMISEKKEGSTIMNFLSALSSESDTPLFSKGGKTTTIQDYIGKLTGLGKTFGQY